MLQDAGNAWLAWMTGMGWQVAVLILAAWALTRLLWRSSATLRYSLWLVVFLKLLLPPSFAAPWSAGTVLDHFVTPHISRHDADESQQSQSSSMLPNTTPAVSPVGISPTVLASNEGAVPLLLAVWLLGGMGLFAFIVTRSQRFARQALQSATPVGSDVQTLADDMAHRLGIHQPVSVRLSAWLPVPAVFGVLHPVIVLPQTLAEELSKTQMSHILGHELAHVRRHDVPVAWFVSLLLCVYWFHPAVWLANYFMRREREMACDDTVLYQTREEGAEYAQTLVRVAEVFRTPTPAGAGLLGMLEVSGNLLMRMQSCVDSMRERRPGWRSIVIAVFFVILLLPMGVWTDTATAQNGQSAAPSAPVIVKLEPANGATEVDPALNKITITFDAEMEQGFSWTGGPPYFPETTGAPHWVDSRTCVLPVKLESGKFYRVGINSQSYKNFRSVAGMPVRPQVLAFTTQNSSPALMDAVNPPTVVSMTPENGASDVSPDLPEMVVTFDRPMGGGFSWTGGGDNYPETTGQPSWSEDKKTCRLPVKLKAGWSYRLGLNSPSYNNFQSEYGVPLSPVLWTFSTAAQ